MPDSVEVRVVDRQRHEIRHLREMQSGVLQSSRSPQGPLAGRGIVTSVYDQELASSWVLLGELARLGVALPIEAWHRPGELSDHHRALLLTLPLDLQIIELRDDVTGFAIKPIAVWRSQFREILWLDADNAPLRDPSFLFDDPEYVEKGSLFWRDTCGTERARTWHPKSAVWQVFGVPPNDAEEFESGQFLIDKARCWPEICLTAHYAFNAALYYRFVLGDKDTFRLAWQRAAHERGRAVPAAWYHEDASLVPYGMMPYGPFHVGRPNRWGAWGGGSVLLQRDRNGRALFHHRNTEKFTIEGHNHFNRDSPNEASYHGHLAALRHLRDPAANPWLPPPPAPPVPSPLSSPLSPPSWDATPIVPCAWGDVFDRLSILDLKAAHLPAGPRRDNVLRERAVVSAAAGDASRFPGGLRPLVDELAAVNAALWSIEDDIRACEREGRFDATFVSLARSVYRENDRRADLKRRISGLLGSTLVEEKSFPSSGPATSG